jgi:histidine ammonia-lyase
MLRAMHVLVATELVVAVRAAQMARRRPSGTGVLPLFEAATRALPAGTDDRAFGRDVEAARDMLAARSAR